MHGHSGKAPPSQPTERRSLLYGCPPLDFGFLRRMDLDAEVQRLAELDVLTEWALRIAQMRGAAITGFDIHFMLSEGTVATSRPYAEYHAAHGWAIAMVCADEMAQRGIVDSESLARLCRLAPRTGGDQPPPQPADLGWWTDAVNAWIRRGLDVESAIASQAELCLALCAAWLTLGCRHRIGRAASSALVAKVGVVANFGACQYSSIVAPEDRASTRG